MSRRPAARPAAETIREEISALIDLLQYTLDADLRRSEAAAADWACARDLVLQATLAVGGPSRTAELQATVADHLAAVRAGARRYPVAGADGRTTWVTIPDRG